MFYTDTIYCALRLDRSCIFLPQSLHGVPSVTGKLVLSLPRPMPVKGITVVLEGKAKLPYDEATLFTSFHEEFTVNRKQSLATSKKLNTFTLPAGDYEFPFDIPLDGNLHETMTGPDHEYHTYEVYGVVEKRWSRDIVVSQPLRVHKAFSLELNDIRISSPSSVQGHWDDKVQYKICIPDSNIPFGSTFPLKFWLAPLSKAVKLGAIHIDVIERHNLKINAPAIYAGQFNLQYLTSSREHTIFSQQYSSTEDNVSSSSEAFDIEWSMSKTVTLPQELDACTQSMNTKNIKINHLVAFAVELEDASGTTSMIKGTIPINIFMSPQVIGDDGVVNGLDMANLISDQDSPPPLYNDHKCDLLLSINRPIVDVCGSESGQDSRFMRYDSSTFECAPSYEQATRVETVLVE